MNTTNSQLSSSIHILRLLSPAWQHIACVSNNKRNHPTPPATRKPQSINVHSLKGARYATIIRNMVANNTLQQHGSCVPKYTTRA